MDRLVSFPFVPFPPFIILPRESPPLWHFFDFETGKRRAGHLPRTGSVSDDKNSLADLDPVSVETTQVLVGPYN